MSITLVTKDGAKVHVCSRIASNFGLVTSIIEDLDNETVNTEFPISEVDSTILAHALAFYSEECDKDTERTPWNPHYFSDMEDETFFKLFVASNYLEATKLLDACAKHLAQVVIECRTPDALKARFDITSEPTEEESAMIQEECDYIVSGFKHSS